MIELDKLIEKTYKIESITTKLYEDYYINLLASEFGNENVEFDGFDLFIDKNFKDETIALLKKWNFTVDEFTGRIEAEKLNDDLYLSIEFCELFQSEENRKASEEMEMLRRESFYW